MTITLQTPIRRGDASVTEIALNKPRAGELQGVSLVALLQMEVTALMTVLPRITEPALTQVEVAMLDAVDLMQFGAAVSGFLIHPVSPKPAPTTPQE